MRRVLRGNRYYDETGVTIRRVVRRDRCYEETDIMMRQVLRCAGVTMRLV